MKKKIAKSDLMKFAAENSWEKSMMSSGMDSFSNYSGPNLGDLVVVLGTSRDADILSVSNFESALEMLGGESKNVMVEQFGHWASGWFKLILVNPEALSKLQIAYEIKKAIEDYPVLDDSDYSEREAEYIDEQFDQYRNEFQRNVLAMLKRSEADLIGTDKEWDEVLRDLFEEACSWNGTESAYIDENTVMRSLDYYSDYSLLGRNISAGNKVAAKIYRTLKVA